MVMICYNTHGLILTAELGSAVIDLSVRRAHLRGYSQAETESRLLLTSPQ